jgi:hypothetical protein
VTTDIASDVSLRVPDVKWTTSRCVRRGSFCPIEYSCYIPMFVELGIAYFPSHARRPQWLYPLKLKSSSAHDRLGRLVEGSVWHKSVVIWAMMDGEYHRPLTLLYTSEIS